MVPRLPGDAVVGRAAQPEGLAVREMSPADASSGRRDQLVRAGVRDVPERVGPAAFGRMGRWVTVRCPRDLAPLIRQAGIDLDQGDPRATC
jgi:hypothetical protein